MRSKPNEGFVSDPNLLPRIREYCLSFPDQKFFRAEEVAFDLQQKYHEYSRKKFKPFVTIVREGLRRLNIKDSSNTTVEKETNLREINTNNDDNDDEVTVVGERKEVIFTNQAAIKPEVLRRDRKRKAFSSNSPTVQEVEDVSIAGDEENGIRLLNVKPVSRTGNLSLTHCDSGKTKVSSISKSSSITKKKRTDVGNAANSAPIDANSARGLGSVQMFSVQPRSSSVTFDDLGGCDRQFLEVCRLAMHMKRPRTYDLLGVEPPKGFLVHGPPGCGKTLFAQAVAGQFNLPMIQIGATELISGVSGETEDKIRQLFSIAKQNAPCVLILDDIDVIAPRRETATREMERRIVSQLCNCLDDLFGRKKQDSIAEKIQVTNDGEVVLNDEMENIDHSYVLVVGTTSRPDSVDGGLRRAGRFDCEISLGIPDERAREKILQTVCKLTLDEDVSLKMIARLTPGYVGADLNALVREAAKCAVNRIFDTIVKNKSSKRRMTNEEIKEELDKARRNEKSQDEIPLLSESVASFCVIVLIFLTWLQADDDPSALERFGGFHVKMSDFERALENVQPQQNGKFPVKRPEDFALLGICAKPQGILLCGPPGCGKIAVG
ncbi:hypothetical protein KIN20_027520 [Parelaphostrongylus tenuis]|uniref:AAA+ ATPase domain-containing protein n=1 Tax=Parelaphostrongylus tenuis TaxID=148309 RepID=A0AAD5QZV2_PARTN|nr:hypothetical protein KIN20_027520 [Parelaphostrongylus tenuis]